jgi:hypothetical protein
VNELLTYAMMSDLLIVVYVQFMILLIDLQKFRFQELKCLCSKTNTLPLE